MVAVAFIADLVSDVLDVDSRSQVPVRVLQSYMINFPCSYFISAW